MEEYICIHSFEATTEKKISMITGDVILLKKQDEKSGWWFGKNQSTGKTGYFPPKFVQRIIPGEEPIRPKHTLKPARFAWCLHCDGLVSAAVHRACVAIQALPSCHVPTIEETSRKRPLLHYTMISKQPSAAGLSGAMDAVTEAEAEQLLTSRDRFQQTCLHIGAQLDKPEFLQVLLQHIRKHDLMTLLDATDREGKTALTAAASAGAFQAVWALVEAGARVSPTGQELHFLCSYPHSEQWARAAEQLSKHRGCDVPNDHALQRLAEKGDVNGLTTLIRLKADVNRATPRPPLHLAVELGHVAAVQLLLSSGADAALPAPQTAREVALEYNQVEILDLLDQVASGKTVAAVAITDNILSPILRSPSSQRSGIIVQRQGFLNEEGTEQSHAPSLHLIQTDRYTPYYTHYFAGKPQRNFVLEDSATGSLRILTVAADSDAASGRRCLVRTHEADEWIFVDGKSKNLNKAIRAALHKDLAGHKLRELKPSPRLYKALEELEKRCVPPGYKFGVLPCYAGQTTEDEWFANEPSPALQTFLDWIGEKIELKGWSEYAAGLDCKNGTTGTHSYFTREHGCSVMFHVAPLLPFFPDDAQQVERKRHIGNDVVVIIFLEDEELFDPRRIASHFNHVFAVVRPVGDSYLIQFCYKDLHQPAPPLLDKDPYPRNAKTKRLLLTKLLNAERHALGAPSFAPKMARVKKELLAALVRQVDET